MHRRRRNCHRHRRRRHQSRLYLHASRVSRPARPDISKTNQTRRTGAWEECGPLSPPSSSPSRANALSMDANVDGDFPIREHANRHPHFGSDRLNQWPARNGPLFDHPATSTHSAGDAMHFAQSSFTAVRRTALTFFPFCFNRMHACSGVRAPVRPVVKWSGGGSRGSFQMCTSHAARRTGAPAQKFGTARRAALRATQIGLEWTPSVRPNPTQRIQHRRHPHRLA